MKYKDIPKKRPNLIGLKFFRLKVISTYAKQTTPKSWTSFCKCQCKCGKIIHVRRTNFLNGHHKSCKCFQYKRRFKHGLSRTSLYRIWQHILQRCYNKKCDNYKYYGKRGIKIHRLWKTSFQRFHTYIKRYLGERPSHKHTIDRINNNGNYEPGNLRWSTSIMQANNKSNNRYITINRKRMSISQAARIYGKTPNQIFGRMQNKKTNILDILTNPLKLRAKLNPTLVCQIRKLYKQGITISDLAKRFKVARATIRAIIKNITWKNS